MILYVLDVTFYKFCVISINALKLKDYFAFCELHLLLAPSMKCRIKLILIWDEGNVEKPVIT